MASNLLVVTLDSESRRESTGANAAQSLVRARLGMTIKSISILDEEICFGQHDQDCGLAIEFDDGPPLYLGIANEEIVQQKIYLAGHDLADELRVLVGKSFYGIAQKARGEAEPSRAHDIAVDAHFIEIVSSGGSAVATVYVEHNGYYGGCSLNVSDQMQFVAKRHNERELSR